MGWKVSVAGAAFCAAARPGTNASAPTVSAAAKSAICFFMNGSSEGG